MGPKAPSGRAAPPPSWLSDISLPIDDILAGSILHRVCKSAHHAVFFGPGAGKPPANRFDSATSLFGVLYAATTLEGAIVETILRNPQRRMVSRRRLRARSVSELRTSRTLRIVRMHANGLQALGLHNSISTGPYEPCGLWADALWRHDDCPDGLAYPSRHDPSQICIALFERPDITFYTGPPIPLLAMPREISRILTAYEKSLPPP